MGSSRGLLYITTGEKYTADAVEAATHLRDRGIDVPIAILSDVDPASDVFDHTVSLSDPYYSLADVPANIHRSPFDKTIYLDADVTILRPEAIRDLFAVLDRSSIAAAFDVGRSGAASIPDVDSEPPRTFPMLNIGITGFQQPDVDEFFERWRELHERCMAAHSKHVNTQIAFRQALWETDVPYTVLPSEYNFIAPSPQFVAADVEIVHGEIANPVGVADAVNDRAPFGGRIYHPVYAPVDHPEIDPWVAGPNERAPVRQLRQSIRTFGLARTVAYTLVGRNPIVGYQRVKRFFEIANEEGYAAGVSEMMDFMGGD